VLRCHPVGLENLGAAVAERQLRGLAGLGGDSRVGGARARIAVERADALLQQAGAAGDQ